MVFKRLPKGRKGKYYCPLHRFGFNSKIEFRYHKANCKYFKVKRFAKNVAKKYSNEYSEK